MLKHLRGPLVTLGAAGALLLSGGAATAMADQGAPPPPYGGNVIDVGQPANSNCPNCQFVFYPEYCNGIYACAGFKAESCADNSLKVSFGSYNLVTHDFYADQPGDLCGQVLHVG